MKTKYSAFGEIIDSPDLGTYKTYGIRIETSEGIRDIHDISIDGTAVKALARDCTRCNLSEVHIFDIISDRFY